MQDVYIHIAGHLGAALLAGSLIGIERTFSGRPAGFRTHALVCVASALLMILTRYQHVWLAAVPADTMRTDPTRMAQGIMTGIGFLGAGVIFKEGLTVRGLTTAASIWITAAIGTLLGVGLYYPAVLATAITLFTLSLFRIVEAKMPSRHFVRGSFRFHRDKVISEAEFRALLTHHHISVATVNYRLCHGGDMFEYQMLIRTIDPRNLQRLSDTLLERVEIVEFHLTTIAN